MSGKTHQTTIDELHYPQYEYESNHEDEEEITPLIGIITKEITTDFNKPYRAIVTTSEQEQYLVTKKPPHRYLGVARTIRFKPNQETMVCDGLEYLTVTNWSYVLEDFLSTTPPSSKLM